MAVVHAATDPTLKQAPHTTDRPGEVHSELGLVHVVHDADHSCVGPHPERCEERDTVLEVDNRVVMVPVPPQMSSCCQIDAEAPPLSHNVVPVSAVIRRRTTVLGGKQGEHRSGSSKPLRDLLGICLGSTRRGVGEVAPVQEQYPAPRELLECGHQGDSRRAKRSKSVAVRGPSRSTRKVDPSPSDQMTGTSLIGTPISVTIRSNSTSNANPSMRSLRATVRARSPAKNLNPHWVSAKPGTTRCAIIRNAALPTER